MSLLRTRWAAVGAAVAITLGAGGIGLVSATVSSGSRAVFVPITPCRIMDTRPGFVVGPKTSPLGPDEIYTVEAHGTSGQCTLPNDASGLALNVTATDATLATFLAVWGDGARPNASSLNPAPGQPPTPNAVTTDLTSGGKFSIFNKQGSVNVFVDVVGYYADHNHDDRYYKKSQVDTQIAATKFLSLNVYADPALNFDDRWHNQNDAGVGGLNLDVDFNFTIPPDYTTGTPMTIRVLGYARNATSFPCNGELSANWVYAARPNLPELGYSHQSLQPQKILYVFSDANVPREYLFTLDGTTDLRAGDSVGFGLAGLGPFTRCELVISGASVLYE